MNTSADPSTFDSIEDFYTFSITVNVLSRSIALGMSAADMIRSVPCQLFERLCDYDLCYVLLNWKPVQHEMELQQSTRVPMYDGGRKRTENGELIVYVVNTAQYET
jgi:hypothetical protein